MAGRGEDPTSSRPWRAGWTSWPLRRRPPRDVAERGRDRHRAGPADRPPAAADPGGARLRPRDRRRLRADPAGARPGHGVRQLARAVGRSPARTWRSWSPDRRVVLDGPARRLRHRLRRTGLGAEDHRAARRDRHPVPGAADLAGQGAAGRRCPRRARPARWPSRAAPGCRRTSAGRHDQLRRRAASRSGPAAGRWPTRSWRPASGRSRCRCATATARSGRR